MPNNDIPSQLGPYFSSYHIYACYRYVHVGGGGIGQNKKQKRNESRLACWWNLWLVLWAVPHCAGLLEWGCLPRSQQTDCYTKPPHTSPSISPKHTAETERIADNAAMTHALYEILSISKSFTVTNASPCLLQLTDDRPFSPGLELCPCR